MKTDNEKIKELEKQEKLLVEILILTSNPFKIKQIN